MSNEILVKKDRLKGGSLSGTYLCLEKDGSQFIRKEVSLIKHREYGFQRWYSQLKKLQRFTIQFPGLFPKIIKFGQDGNSAYFDLEYVEGSQTVHAFLMTSPSNAEIGFMFDALILSMHRMHKEKFKSNPSALDLYIHEEMEKKIFDCMENKNFSKLLSKKFITFNGKKILGIGPALGQFRRMMNQAAYGLTECFTHGNITLENILYDPIRRKITFIDPYEENIVDTRLAEYSQILQSSNSNYEIYNLVRPVISLDGVDANIVVPDSLRYFNKIFIEFIKSDCTNDEITLIKLFEVSQYIRMLPFKMQIDEDKMILFYCLASFLFDELTQRIKN